MEFVKQIAQRIVVLHQGEKLTEGSVHEVQNNPVEVYLVVKEAMPLLKLTDVSAGKITRLLFYSTLI